MFSNVVDARETQVTVLMVPGLVSLHGETFRGCIKVIEYEPGLRRTSVRYYQKWAGEVVAVVYEDSDPPDADGRVNGRRVYSRVLITEDHQ